MTDALGNLSSKEPYQVSRGNDNSSTGSAENTYTIPEAELPPEPEETDLEEDLETDTDTETETDRETDTETDAHAAYERLPIHKEWHHRAMNTNPKPDSNNPASAAAYEKLGTLRNRNESTRNDGYTWSRSEVNPESSRYPRLKVAAKVVATIIAAAVLGAAGGLLTAIAVVTLAPVWPVLAGIGIVIALGSLIAGSRKGMIVGAAIALGPLAIGALTLAAIYKTAQTIMRL